jgi:hypothetical protein
MLSSCSDKTPLAMPMWYAIICPRKVEISTGIGYREIEMLKVVLHLIVNRKQETPASLFPKNLIQNYISYVYAQVQRTKGD